MYFRELLQDPVPRRVQRLQAQWLAETFGSGHFTARTAAVQAVCRYAAHPEQKPLRGLPRSIPAWARQLRALQASGLVSADAAGYRLLPHAAAR